VVVGIHVTCGYEVVLWCLGYVVAEAGSACLKSSPGQWVQVQRGFPGAAHSRVLLGSPGPIRYLRPAAQSGDWVNGLPLPSAECS
jgi:hypothetical protein